MNPGTPKSVALIVAHPDDETLWAGGTMLSHPSWKFFIVCLCRKSDFERAARFSKALTVLKAEGIMGDLDDGPDQTPLDTKEVKQMILDLLPSKHFDMIISHHPHGEYTRHIRHEETGSAVIELWHTGKIFTHELRIFAYGERAKEHYPRADENATVFSILTQRIWQRKYTIITKTYGFKEDSWEAKTTPGAEAFWQFSSSSDAKILLTRQRDRI